MHEIIHTFSKQIGAAGICLFMHLFTIYGNRVNK